jgi:hypothetical protein
VTEPGCPVIVIASPAPLDELRFTRLITDIGLVVDGDTVNVAVAIIPSAIVVEFIP